MRIWLTVCLLGLLAVAGLSGGLALGQAATSTGSSRGVTDGGITVYFSPNGGATQAVVAEIAQAKATVQIQAYSFTSAEIAKALLEAHKRGVKVVAVLDKSQQTAKYSGATFLHNAGITVLIDDKHAIAHNKVIIIDGKTVITGSFNFTKAAEESNAENLLVIKERPGLAAAYLQNFKNHLGHAGKYQGLQDADAEPAGQPQAPGEVLAVPTPAASAAPQAAPRADADVTVHVTKSSKKYHAAGCSSLAKSDIPMKLSQAKAKGYTACSRCRPGE